MQFYEAVHMYILCETKHVSWNTNDIIFWFSNIFMFILFSLSLFPFLFPPTSLYMTAICLWKAYMHGVRGVPTEGI